MKRSNDTGFIRFFCAMPTNGVFTIPPNYNNVDLAATWSTFVKMF